MANSRWHQGLVSPRQLLSRHLVGTGIELGPGHHPFVFGLPGAQVHYVDRWRAPESALLFPQVQGVFKEPDVIADFNTDRLSPVPDKSQDFVIASHVLEHLAEPIGFLAEIHRVLRPGGVALILLPDRRRTKDRHRPPTPLTHLVAEHNAKVDEISDDHLVEFLQDRGRPLGTTREEQERTLDHYRKRSIHVHCWDAPEFLQVILWGIENLDEHWEFVDGCLPLDSFPPGIEFGFVLRRSTVSTDSATRRQRCESAWTTWNNSRVGPTQAAEIWMRRTYYEVRRIDQRARRYIRARRASER